MAAPQDGKHGLELVHSRPHTRQYLLDTVAQRSLETTSTLLSQFFSATDDLFYELSERASTNNEENLYFEAMRAIRVSSQELTKSFEQTFKQNFVNMADLGKHAHSHAAKDYDDLSLVNREQLELDLAQKNMADRTRDTYKTEVYELSARLTALTTEFSVTEVNNPLDPFQLSKNFVTSSSAHLKLDIKTRLIFFKLFEKHFLKQLGHLYSEANSTLIEAGILPKVPRKALDKTVSQPTIHSAIEEQSQRASEAQFESFDGIPIPPAAPFQLEPAALASLMSSIRAAKDANHPGIQALGNYHYFSDNPGTVMPVPELADFLTDTQTNIDRRLTSEAPQNLVPQIVADILSLRNPDLPQALEQPDEDIINLVALFFDKVLEDENLPLALQSLICRLQIPVLKVALHDKSFLSNDSHPARILINTITDAGLSFDETKPLEKDPLYRCIAEGVQKINHQFKLDSHVFDEVTRTLRAALKAEMNRSAVVETRTTQTETGKAKLNAAKTFSQSALFEKLKEVSLPPQITGFLTNTWLQVMIITYIRGSKDSAQWVENEQLISDLIWVSQQYSDEKSQARQKRIAPDILNRIELGLELIIDNAESRQAKTADIDKALQTVFSNPKPESYQKLNEEQRNLLGKRDPGKKNWEEMTALERQQARYEELSSQYYLEAKNMKVGTWLEYLDEAKGRQLRCKLSAKIDAENYVFVTRFGFKALSRTRRQFAYDMQFKKAKPLDTTPIFERIMERVVAQIKSLSKDL